MNEREKREENGLRKEENRRNQKTEERSFEQCRRDFLNKYYWIKVIMESEDGIYGKFALHQDVYFFRAFFGLIFMCWINIWHIIPYLIKFYFSTTN